MSTSVENVCVLHEQFGRLRRKNHVLLDHSFEHLILVQCIIFVLICTTSTICIKKTHLQEHLSQSLNC